MNSKLIAIIAGAILLTGFIIYQLLPTKAGSAPVTVKQGSPEQYVVLLDLSDRITKPGQIEADKQLIEKTFREFRDKVRAQLCINSKDRFQVFIAPQKGLPFDKDVESQKLTLDMPSLKPGEKAKALKDFESKLRVKLDSLYSTAYRGTDSKNYQGSNIWQFFNETLAEITSPKIATKLLVLTDGYFDFEENNAIMNSGGLSTSTNFLPGLRRSADWKTDLLTDNCGLMPVQRDFPNLSVCVVGIRSKYENNLIEADMLKHIWERWCYKSNIDTTKLMLVYHGSVVTSGTKLNEFFSRGI